jgi:hypothetical protein
MTIESELETVGSVIIYDLTGKIVAKNEMVTPNITYKFGSELSKGMYIAVIRQGDQMQNFRIVKTN